MVKFFDRLNLIFQNCQQTSFLHSIALEISASDFAETKIEIIQILSCIILKIGQIYGLESSLNEIIVEDEKNFPMKLRGVNTKLNYQNWTILWKNCSEIFARIVSTDFSLILQKLGKKTLHLSMYLDNDPDLSIYGSLAVLFLKFNFPQVYQKEFLFSSLCPVLSSALNNKSPFIAQSGILLFRQLYSNLQILENFEISLFDSLTNLCLRNPIQNIRLNGITILNSIFVKLSYRAQYVLFLKALPNADTKLSAFLIPKIKDFFLNEKEKLDYTPLWNEILKTVSNEGDIGSQIDRIMPTINLIRGAKIAKLDIASQEQKILKYLDYVTTEIFEGRKFYELESTQTENEEKKSFYDSAIVQVDLVNSILDQTKQLFDTK